MAIGWTWFSL